MYNFVFSVLFVSIFSVYGDENSCAFCRPNVIENQLVYESESFNVLLDFEPRMMGHLLVVSKRHLVKAHELSKEEWSEFSKIIPQIVQVFSKFLDTENYIILEKNGKAAFQDIPHMHFHLFPVHHESWSEIFDIIPERVSSRDLKQQVDLFKRYFYSLDNAKFESISIPE